MCPSLLRCVAWQRHVVDGLAAITSCSLRGHLRPDETRHGTRRLFLEPPSSSDRETEKDADGIDYPEGGLKAWLVVLGSWCAMTAGLGIANSTGIFEAYVSNTVLSSSSTLCLTFVSHTKTTKQLYYYQLLLVLSILSGTGNSFVFTPAMGAISQWFNKRRGAASGVAFVGSGFEGFLFP